jgi:hypothetical protein
MSQTCTEDIKAVKKKHKLEEFKNLIHTRVNLSMCNLVC